MRTFSELLKPGEGEHVPLGTWSQIGAPEVIDILGTCGFDFVILDAQHTSLTMQTLENMARACAANGLVPIVRVADNLPHLILQACDLGAAAVVVPGISTREAAEAAVRAARFGPSGQRSACPMVRSAGQFTADWRAYAERSDAETGVIALVETPEGIENCDAIATVPGLAAILAGPFDLAVAMGHGNDMRHSEVVNAMAKLVEAARLAGVPLIMPIFAPAAEECRQVMEEWMQRGVRLFTVGGDKLFLADYVRRYVGEMRARRPSAVKSRSRLNAN
jgi:2-keto-3-deoxy-L-rhamnonate aldolase RhmA